MTQKEIQIFNYLNQIFGSTVTNIIYNTYVDVCVLFKKIGLFLSLPVVGWKMWKDSYKENLKKIQESKNK
jgi:hypothetical protein